MFRAGGAPLPAEKRLTRPRRGRELTCLFFRRRGVTTDERPSPAGAFDAPYSPAVGVPDRRGGLGRVRAAVRRNHLRLVPALPAPGRRRTGCDPDRLCRPVAPLAGIRPVEGPL